jgi:L-cysteine:1D-myo-inositol 2-amino-2-deoxy-alpha-D-glucopyranoside ligase
VVAKLRSALADDLNTPKALHLIDGWAADTSLAGAPVAAAIDALLGIRLN